MTYTQMLQKLKKMQEEITSTGAMLYFGKDFAVDVVAADFDLSDIDNEYALNKKKLPWEIKNALRAEKRREEVLAWIKSAGDRKTQAVNKYSLPRVPKWQQSKKK